MLSICITLFGVLVMTLFALPAIITDNRARHRK